MDESFDYIRRIVPETSTTFLVPSSSGAPSFSGPGDVVSSAIAFWGLRAYSSASIGLKAIRLRETGGNTEQDFVTIAGGGLDLTAISTFKGANNLFVVTIYDQISTHDVTQPVAGQQPQFILSAIGSLPAVQFINANSTLLDSGAGLTQTQPFTVSLVYNNNNDTGAQVAIYSSSPIELGVHRAVANDVFQYSGSLVPVAAANAATWHSLQSVYNGASSDLYVDGTTNPGDLGNTTGITASQVLGSIGGGQFYNGLFGEAGIWPVAFSAGQEASMNTNQHTYWGF